MSSIPYITREALSALLPTLPPPPSTHSAQNPTTSPPTATSPSPSPSPAPHAPRAKTVAVIDVRDADHIGGHIRTSRHHPSSTLGSYLPTLVRTLHDDGVEVVVFHCALSQVRGPSAARGYVRERERMLGEEEGRGQEVFVLRGGFVAWQEL